MDVCQVYFVDSKCPSSYTVSADGNLLKLLYYDYHTNAFGHVDFVHHEYADYWEQGVPVIHVTNNLSFRKGEVKEGFGKFITVFLPNNVSSENACELLKQVEEIEESFGEQKCYHKLVYVKEKTGFGYNYECYPPMYTSGAKIPFKEAISIFLRDAFHSSTSEEKIMFDEFRNFEISKMLTESNATFYPVNHNYCGVIAINNAGERYTSSVTKTGHQETLNYLLSCMTSSDINEEDAGLLQKIIDLSVSVLLFREGEVLSYIPERISKLQYNELSKIADEIDSFSSVSDVVFSARVLEDGTLVGDELSFHENILNSYQEVQKRKK